MKALGLLAFALLLSSPAGAQAPAIVLPLSQYGSLDAPSLEVTGLKAAARRTVEMAIAAAHGASARAKAAEAVESRAINAAEKARAAARRARDKAQGLESVSFSGGLCRYAGEMKDAHAQGSGVMLCGPKKFEGEFKNGAPSGLVMAQDQERVYLGAYRNGKENGLGGDYARNGADAYEGEYKDGARSGLGLERDKDGAYPGRYGFAKGAQGKPIAMELIGLQDFEGVHWAGTYGFYSGPRIACTLIQGAVLEGSVLDGFGAKFDHEGRLTGQGLYRLGRLTGSTAPPC
jgi:hypothetical protein